MRYPKHLQIATKLFTVAFVLLCTYVPFLSHAGEEDLFGIWKTGVSKKGSYLHVDIRKCEDKICGFIVNAFDKNDEPVADYPHVGKIMVWNMQPKSSPNSWGKGGIWAPDTDKKYKSGMVLTDDTLKVTGCISLGWPCRSQTWTPVSP